ncbi:SET and MYND domain-containing protein 4 isoform X1 [Anopheles stephensi]|uniref:SET and MYND domain-containing protein 4 isoform X1 n=1 Tax=Anopheles stephensi TaxID=30069 RepID=UPI0016588677|nr:SET and MYND domain-containing protein 4 isoform X1 [Anopheles stephensi]
MTSIDNDPLFTSLCNEKTLQSQKEGFFNEFYHSVAENFTGKSARWLTEVYQKVPTDQERLRLIYEDPVVCYEVQGTLEHVEPVFRAKDAKFSWQRREQALKLLGENKLQQALIMACQAVMRAPGQGVDRFIDKGLTLALALWTRAEVFIRMLDGKRGLQDLQLASKCGLPVKQNADYYARVAKCYALSGENSRAEVAAKLFHQLSGHNDYALTRLKEDMEDLRVLKQETPSVEVERALPKLAGAGENSEIAGASTKIKLAGSKEDPRGRYVIAAADLGPGEVILTEPAYAACLHPKYFGTHCTACFSRLIAPVACPDCCGVAFCSIACRDKACATYHRFECRYLDLMIGSGMSILCHVALRMVTQAGTPQKVIQEGHMLRDTFCAHTEHRDPEDHFKRTLMTAFLLRCLQKAEFFGRRTTEAPEPTELELQVGAVLLSALQSLQFNAHEVYETRITGEHRFDTAKVQYIGVGIYRGASMFNHECYPGVTRSFLGTSMILHTSRPIPAGAVVPENYGPHFLRQPKPVRQRNLRSRYWFKCDCRACNEDWPKMDKLPDKPRLRCTTADCGNALSYPSKPSQRNVKCNKCKKQINLEASVKMLEASDQLCTTGAEMMASHQLEDERVDEAIELLKKGITLFGQVAVPPHKPTLVAEESLRSCFADKGNANRY